MKNLHTPVYYNDQHENNMNDVVQQVGDHHANIPRRVVFNDHTHEIPIDWHYLDDRGRHLRRGPFSWAKNQGLQEVSIEKRANRHRERSALVHKFQDELNVRMHHTVPKLNPSRQNIGVRIFLRP
jgi:hypothetical protein